jgi:hypothetical protein
MSAVKMGAGSCVKRQGKREEVVRAGLTAAALPSGGIELGGKFRLASARGFIICPATPWIGLASSLPVSHLCRVIRPVAMAPTRRTADSTRNIRYASMRYTNAVHIKFAAQPACDNGANESNPGGCGGQALRAGAELSAKGIIRRQPQIGNPPVRFHTRGYVQ